MDGAHIAGIVFLSLMHVLGHYLDIGRFHHRRRWISIAAGVSVAYVFVDLMPLMSEMQRDFLAHGEGHSWLFPEFRVYVAALVGFALFYGLGHLVEPRGRSAGLAEEAGPEESAPVLQWLCMGSFVVYNMMMGYLLVEWAKEPVALALYCGALGLHFLVTDNSMRRDYGETYDHIGRWLMAAGVMVGGLLAYLAPISIDWLAIVVGLVAGGVVINSVRDELPGPHGGRFLPFLGGSFIYAAVILFAERLAAG